MPSQYPYYRSSSPIANHRWPSFPNYGLRCICTERMHSRQCLEIYQIKKPKKKNTWTDQRCWLMLIPATRFRFSISSTSPASYLSGIEYIISGERPIGNRAGRRRWRKSRTTITCRSQADVNIARQSTSSDDPAHLFRFR